MFAHSNPNDRRVTHARLGKQIIDSQSAEPSITVEFEEGYVNDGQFISLGTNHITLTNHPATETEPERRDYDEAIMVAKDAIGPGYTDKCEAWLVTKL